MGRRPSLFRTFALPAVLNLVVMEPVDLQDGRQPQGAFRLDQGGKSAGQVLMFGAVRANPPWAGMLACGRCNRTLC
jgi:hypothetical protein